MGGKGALKSVPAQADLPSPGCSVDEHPLWLFSWSRWDVLAAAACA